MQHLLYMPENTPDTNKSLYQTGYRSGHQAEHRKLETFCFETEITTKY